MLARPIDIDLGEAHLVKWARALAVQAVRRARRQALSYASRLLGMRWAARWIAARVDRERWASGRPTVLCLRRALFAKDIDVLRSTCNLNFVCIEQGILGRLQRYWISHDFRRQTHYQYCSSSEYNRDWQRIGEFGSLIMRAINRHTPVDAILAANIDYWQDQGILVAARKLNIPFLVLRREQEISDKTRERAFQRYSQFKFEGDGVAAFGRTSLKPLIESGACRAEQVVVTGAPRLDCWHDVNPSNQDTDSIVLLSYRDPVYGASNSFREVLELFVDCAKKASSTCKARFVVKAKSHDDALAIHQVLAMKPTNVLIEHDTSLFDLFHRSRLVIGFDSLAVVEALLSKATVVVPFWGDAKGTAESTMFHPSRDQHRKALLFAESRAALSELTDRAARSDQRDRNVDREARLNVVNQFMAWSPQQTASERVESWIRASIRSRDARMRTVSRSIAAPDRGDTA